MRRGWVLIALLSSLLPLPLFLYVGPPWDIMGSVYAAAWLIVWAYWAVGQFLKRVKEVRYSWGPIGPTETPLYRAHKAAIFDAWSDVRLAAPRLYDLPTDYVIGGERAVRQVVDVLRESEALARIEWERVEEQRLGEEMWAGFERETDDEMLTTLQEAIPPRAGEVPAVYTARLRAVERAFRARIPESARHEIGEVDSKEAAPRVSRARVRKSKVTDGNSVTPGNEVTKGKRGGAR